MEFILFCDIERCLSISVFDIWVDYFIVDEFGDHALCPQACCQVKGRSAIFVDEVGVYFWMFKNFIEDFVDFLGCCEMKWGCLPLVLDIRVNVCML